MKVDVITIGAHPDDCEISMGGTIAKFVSKGYKVLILDLTNGEPTPKGDPEKRLKEAKKAAEILGAYRITLDLKNRFLFDTIEARIKVASIIRNFKPEIIFSHLELDAHPDHIQAFNISYASRFYSKLTKLNFDLFKDFILLNTTNEDLNFKEIETNYYPKKIFRFFSNHLRMNLTPSFVIDISDFIDKKIEACKAYESQFSSFQVEHYIKTFAQYWGLLARTDYAEPFYNHEIFKINSIEVLFD
ncbi:MAG: PIG-L family deacetylase [bacterium]|nr:PIG-L family deacetylase [bacterium]